MNSTFQALADRHGIDETLLDDLVRQLQRTGGRQAQFNHPALGGLGQWQNGMLIIGTMNDHALKARVAAFFDELVPLAGSSQLPEQPRVGMKPGIGTSQVQGQASAGLGGRGRSSFSGSQNGISYRYDSSENQLILNESDRYDTTGYQLTGVSASQQSGASSSLVIHTDAGLKELRDFRKLR